MKRGRTGFHEAPEQRLTWNLEIDPALIVGFHCGGYV